MNDNDTRTARERAEELAADEWRRDEALAAEAERQTPFNGWENAMENAALQQKFIDGANWQAARDAEPTTVSAEQIEAAAYQIASFEGFNYHGMDAGDRGFYDHLATVAFRAAGIAIEGDPA